MKKQLPVYDIKKFRHVDEENNFYANRLKPHIKEHHFTNKPHKHDFYMTMLFTKGNGVHSIDFTDHKVKPGALFTLSPGQVHSWKLSEDADGYIFFHTKTFYDEGFTSERVNDYPFFNSVNNQPYIQLKKERLLKAEQLFGEILNEYSQQKRFRFRKLHALVNVLYIDLARDYSAVKNNRSEKYLEAVRKFENLVDKYYKEEKFPSYYASLMNITERHLNRICKICLNKTPTELISDRIMLEAKRMLVHADKTISEVAEELGYFDNSYFSRAFKSKTGFRPKEFVKDIR